MVGEALDQPFGSPRVTYDFFLVAQTDAISAPPPPLSVRCPTFLFCPWVARLLLFPVLPENLLVMTMSTNLLLLLQFVFNREYTPDMNSKTNDASKITLPAAIAATALNQPQVDAYPDHRDASHRQHLGKCPFALLHLYNVIVVCYSRWPPLRARGRKLWQ